MARTNLAVPSGLVPLNAFPSDPIIRYVQSNNSAALYVGEPVHLQTDGTVLRQAAGTSTDAATDGIYGVVSEIIRYKDANGVVRSNSKYLPASTTWTNLQTEGTQVAIIPAFWPQIYRVRMTALPATYAAAIALIGSNCNFAYGTADTGLGLSGLVVSTAAGGTTAAMQLRIVDVYPVVQNDPTVTNWCAEVMINLPCDWPILGHSTTGL